MHALWLLLGIIGSLYLRAKIKRKKHPPLPPGPRADPFIGHVRLMDTERQDELFYEWGRTYGDVIYLNVLGQSIIVLNSFQAAKDLLDRRNANYSDRPRLDLFELMGWDNSMSFMRYGKNFQRHRRLLQQYLRSERCVEYQPIQRREVRILLQNLLSNHAERDKHLDRFSTGIIMQVAYGHQMQSKDDQYMVFSEKVNDALNGCGPPGATPVDFFPILKSMPSWFPGTYYATFVRKSKRWIDALHDIPFDDVQRRMSEGSAGPSFVSYHLNHLTTEKSNNPITPTDIKAAAGTMYGAGAETTWSTMSTFIFAMLLHPACQERAQKEIDNVVGPGRLPDFSDRSSLPFVESVFQETLRWHSAVPLGIPHCSLQDDIYRGMFIPGGSVVIANIRGMGLDDAIYSDPHTFNPSRFLPQPEGNEEPHPSQHEAFGFGRRICPGRHLAEASVWLAIASVLCAFDISPVSEENAIKYERDVRFQIGLTSKPPAYKCNILPRSKAAQSLITDMVMWDTT